MEIILIEMESEKVLGPGNERCKCDQRLFRDDKAYIWWCKGGDENREWKVRRWNMLELSGGFETYIFGRRYGQPMRWG